MKTITWEFIQNNVSIDEITQCWIWKKTTNQHGYGVTSIQKRQRLVHRLVYELRHGVQLSRGQNVCHSCDNPPCCNPDHLWIGSQSDNLKDMWAKKRHWTHTKSYSPKSGEGNYNSKLTARQVAEIRKIYIPYKTSQESLARIYGVGRGAIAGVVQGRNWKGVDPCAQ